MTVISATTPSLTTPLDFREGEVMCFDKPYGFTSFDVVNKARGVLCHTLGVRKLKVGHAGTLDPLATGVMVLCTGRATKRIDELQAHTKEYVATVTLGATTPSFDLEKPIDALWPTDHITRRMVEETLPRFVGTIEQIPPRFSACKVGGRRAYDMARRGHEVELKPKTLVIDEMELLDCHLAADCDAANADDRPYLTLRIVCSKGTYIRALTRDIGVALGSGAHLTALRRTRVGDLRAENGLSIATFQQWLDDRIARGEVVTTWDDLPAHTSPEAL